MESILETFYILFKSNAKEVKKDHKELAKESDTLNESFLKLGKSLAEMAAAYFTTTSAIHNLRGAFDYQLGIARASQALDINAKELDAWQRAVSQAGVTAQGFQASVVSFAEKTGIRYKDALKFFPLLAEQLSKMPKDVALRVGKEAGLDPMFITFLEQGKKAVEDIIKKQRELSVVNEESSKKILAFSKAWADSTQRIDGTWQAVVDRLLENSGGFIEALNKIAAFFTRYPDLIVGALLTIAAAVGAFAVSLVLANIEIIGFITVASFLYSLLKKMSTDPDSYLSGFISGLTNRIAQAKELFKSLKHDVQVVIDFFNRLTHLRDNARNRLVDSALSTAKQRLSQANAFPLNASTSQSISSSTAHKNTTVNTGPITINTQATNGKEVGMTLGKSLSDYIRHATGAFDDSVRI